PAAAQPRGDTPAVLTSASAGAAANPAEGSPSDPFDCPEGQLPGLEQPRKPKVDSGGANSPEAAVRAAHSDADLVTARPFARTPGSPVWLETSAGETFVAQQLADE